MKNTNHFLYFKKLHLISLSLVFLSVLYSQSNIGAQGLYLPFNIVIWLLVGLLSLVSILKVIRTKRVYITNFLNFTVSFLLLVLSIGLINTNLDSVDIVLVSFSFLGISLFLFALTQYNLDKKDLIFLLYVLCFVGFMESLISFIQIHDDKFWVFTNVIQYAALTISKGVPVGSFQQVNMLATFLVFALISTLFLLLHDEIKYKFKYLAIFNKFILIVLAVIFSYVIALSGSRAALLALFISLIFLIIGSIKQLKNRKLSFLFWLFAILIGVYLAHLFSGGAPGILGANEKMSKVIVGGDVRWLLYDLAYHQFMESPLIGHGIGNYLPSLLETASKIGVAKEFEEVDLTIFKHPHNEIVYWLINSGVVVLLGVLLLIFLYFKSLMHSYSLYGFALFALATPFLISSQLSYPFTLSVLHLILLVLFLSVGVQKSRYTVNIDFGSFKIPSYLLLLSAAFIMIYSAWHTLVSTKEVVYFNDRALYQAFATQEQNLSKVYLEHASDNPLYKKQADIEMNAMVVNAFTTNNALEVIQFVHWALRKDSDDYDAETVINLIKSFVFLKQPEEALEIFRTYALNFKDNLKYQKLGKFLELRTKPLDNSDAN